MLASLYSSTINRNIKTIRFLLPTKENRKTNRGKFFWRKKEEGGTWIELETVARVFTAAAKDPD